MVCVVACECTDDAGCSSGWCRYDYFDPSIVHAGGQTITVATPLQYFPVFAKTGSILALNVSNDDAGHGVGANMGGYTLVVHTPSFSPSGVAQDVYEYKANGLRASYVVSSTGAPACNAPVTIKFNVTATPHAVTLLLQNVKATSDTFITATTVGGNNVEAEWVHVLTSPTATSSGGVPQIVVKVPNPQSGAQVSIPNVSVVC